MSERNCSKRWKLRKRKERPGVVEKWIDGNLEKILWKVEVHFVFRHESNNIIHLQSSYNFRVFSFYMPPLADSKERNDTGRNVTFSRSSFTSWVVTLCLHDFMRQLCLTRGFGRMENFPQERVTSSIFPRQTRSAK